MSRPTAPFALPITPEQAQAAILAGESQSTELAPESAFQTDLAEALAAFANAGAAATLFVGVQDRPISIRGVGDVAGTVSRVYSAARQVSPPLHDWLQVAPLVIGDKTVVAAWVPANAPGVYHVG